jgi:uncharacterized peroxidase-related enzyme
LEDTVPWIATIADEDAAGRLRQLYDRIKGPDGHVDNIMSAHSLRPHTMDGHLALYKNVLHHTSNTVPTWFLEVVGVLVSQLNDCDYCVDHHAAGLARLLDDAPRVDRIRASLRDGRFADAFDPPEQAALRYAAKLTTSPMSVAETDVRAMRDAGLDDGQILEINQVVAYFAYANRMVLGLGIDTAGDTLGLSPSDSDDPRDLGHR